jgi:hypothetical protein
MESILGITYPKADLEVYKDWLKYSDTFTKK